MQELMPIINIIRNTMLVFVAFISLMSANAQSQKDSTSITSYAQLVAADTIGGDIFDEAIARAERILKMITMRREKFDFAIYPAASYSGQSGLAVGLMPMLRIKNSTNANHTIITPSALVSTKKMWELQCDADIYLGTSNQIEAKVELYHQPDDYYGLYSDYDGQKQATYHVYRYELTTTYLRNIAHKFCIGPSVDFAYHKFRNINTDTLTVEVSIANDAGWTNGIGASVCFDTRDNHANTTNGWYVILKYIAYSKLFGSDSHFSVLSVDARRYWSVGIGSVIAMQAYCGGVIGTDAPFYKMMTFGGTRLGRAVPHCQKYADRYAWLYQAEMRYPMFWRIGGTVWTGIGNAAHKVDDSILHNSHGMLGVGLRFKVFADKGLNVRLDGGVSTHGDHAIYFNVREAF